MINSKQHGVQNSGPWDPWHQTKIKVPAVPAGGVWCRIQDPGIVDSGGGKQPTFRTARTHRTVRPNTYDTP